LGTEEVAEGQVVVELNDEVRAPPVSVQKPAGTLSQVPLVEVAAQQPTLAQEGAGVAEHSTFSGNPPPGRAWQSSGKRGPVQEEVGDPVQQPVGVQMLSAPKRAAASSQFEPAGPSWPPRKAQVTLSTVLQPAGKPKLGVGTQQADSKFGGGVKVPVQPVVQPQVSVEIPGEEPGGSVGVVQVPPVGEPTDGLSEQPRVQVKGDPAVQDAGTATLPVPVAAGKPTNEAREVAPTPVISKSEPPCSTTVMVLWGMGTKQME